MYSTITNTNKIRIYIHIDLMKTKETESIPCLLHNSVLSPMEDEFQLLPGYSDIVMRDFKEKTLKKKKKEWMKTPIAE